MTTTTTKVTRTTTPASDQIDALLADAQADLAAKLAAGNPLMALEAPDLLAQFRQTALALKLAVAQRPVPDSLMDDPAAFTASFLREQLAKEAAVLLGNAEARVFKAQRDADGIWRAHVDNEQRKARWAHAGQGQGGRR